MRRFESSHSQNSSATMSVSGEMTSICLPSRRCRSALSRIPAAPKVVSWSVRMVSDAISKIAANRQLIALLARPFL
jgi:hypothetical protein